MKPTPFCCVVGGGGFTSFTPFCTYGLTARAVTACHYMRCTSDVYALLSSVSIDCNLSTWGSIRRLNWTFRMKNGAFFAFLLIGLSNDPKSQRPVNFPRMISLETDEITIGMEIHLKQTVY